MYDTIDLTVIKSDLPDVDFLNEFPQYLTFIKTEGFRRNERGEYNYVSGYLDSLEVFITPFSLKIHGSICKYYHGNNINTLTLKEAQEAFQRISDTLGIPLSLMHVTRMDIAANIEVDQPVQTYLSLLDSVSRYSKRTYEGKGVSFETKKQKLVFYDKNKELNISRKNPILRYEWRVNNMKSLKVIPKNGEFVTVEDLCAVDFWNKIVDGWYKRYLSVLKKTLPQYDWSRVKGVKELKILGLSVLCEMFPVREILKENVKNGVIKESTFKSIKSILKDISFSLPERKHNLIEELDMKMKAVVEQFKQQI